MKMPEVQKHFLALMDRPGDCIFVDISKLDIANGYQPNNLAELDTFTMYFSTPEIIEAIKRANIADERYINGTLVIQDNQKHKPLPIIDRDFYDNFRIDLFLKDHMDDKNTMNMIINKFGSFIKDEEVLAKFKDAIRSNNVTQALEVVFSMPYLTIRKFIVYLIELRDQEKEKMKEQELIRDKAA